MGLRQSLRELRRKKSFTGLGSGVNFVKKYSFFTEYQVKKVLSVRP